MNLLNVNLTELFHIENPISELILRGTVMYLGILFLLRIMPRRTGGEMATMDLLFVVLIAEAATHSLGGYSSITEGFIVILTLIFWNFTVNSLSYYLPFFEQLVSSPALQVVKDGKMLRRNMRREFLTEDELMEHLRREGIEDLKDIKAAFIEGDGEISFISKKSNK